MPPFSLYKIGSDRVEKKPIRVAQIMGKWVGGGVEAVIMNYYRHIDKSKIQFDFICDEDSTNIPCDEIKSLGGRIIICPPYQKLFKYIKTLKKIFKENDYQIVHSNLNTLSVFPLYAAKKAGVKIRIAHNHSTANKLEKKKTLIKNILKPFAKRYATHYFACTEHAGRWLFGNKTFEEGKVAVINNAIEIEKFKFDEELRKAKRKELNLKDTDIVIGHIGRFVEQKNHRFIIDLFNELYKENDNYKLVLIGQGPLETEMKEKVKSYGLENAILFTGQKEDAYNYYNAFDLFIFPSLYEGLGMVAVEAQYNGLTCIASTEVPEIAKICDNIKFIKLEDGIETWKNEILKENIVGKDRDNVNIKTDIYDITKEAEKIEKKYLEISKGA